MHVLIAVGLFFLLAYIWVVGIPAVGAALMIVWYFLPIFGAVFLGMPLTVAIYSRTGDLDAAAAVGVVIFVATCSFQVRWNCYIEGKPPRWWWD